MKWKRYTEEEKAWVLQQMLPPLNRTAVEMAMETGITDVTLRTWYKQARREAQPMAGHSGHKRDRRWSSADKFRAVLETAPLSEEEVAEYCRGKGIQPEQLRQWRHACERANDPSQASEPPSVAAVKQIKELQRELRRKEAALAEAAALLVLRKKAEAIWGKGEEE
jgi:transposase-like protein